MSMPMATMSCSDGMLAPVMPSVTGCSTCRSGLPAGQWNRYRNVSGMDFNAVSGKREPDVKQEGEGEGAAPSL